MQEFNMWNAKTSNRMAQDFDLHTHQRDQLDELDNARFIEIMTTYEAGDAKTTEDLLRAAGIIPVAAQF